MRWNILDAYDMLDCVEYRRLGIGAVHKGQG